MTHFNFHRFAMLLRLDLIGEWRKNAIIMGGLFMACFIIMLFKLTYHASMSSYDYQFHAADHLIASTSLVFICILWVLCMFKGASMLMQHTRSKQQFIAHFTLPATTAEKYAARMTYLLLGQTAGFVLCFVTADIVQGVLFCTMHDVPTFFTPFALKYIGDFLSDTDGTTLAITLLTVLYWHASYTLGATLFRRWPFVLTTFCNWLLGLLIITGLVSMHYSITHRPQVIINMSESGLKAFSIIWSVALCTAFYTLSYFLYRRRQLA